jgi:hypothetical protein
MAVLLACAGSCGCYGVWLGIERAAVLLCFECGKPGEQSAQAWRWNSDVDAVELSNFVIEALVVWLLVLAQFIDGGNTDCVAKR